MTYKLAAITCSTVRSFCYCCCCCCCTFGRGLSTAILKELHNGAGFVFLLRAIFALNRLFLYSLQLFSLVYIVSIIQKELCSTAYIYACNLIYNRTNQLLRTTFTQDMSFQKITKFNICNQIFFLNTVLCNTK